MAAAPQFSVGSLGRDGYQGDMTSAQIRPAGLVTRLNETAADALRWGQRPPTPDHQKKYRQSVIHEPGKIVRHFGAADDPVPEGTFGRQTDLTDSVAKQLQASFPTTEMGRWRQEQDEDIYASSKREPLGKGYVRGHIIPDHLGTQRPFGVAIDAQAKEREGQARQLMFPVDQAPQGDEEGTAAHTMYVQSHGAYAPGEQRRRQYDWGVAGVDPATYRFGAVDKQPARDGVRNALQPALDQTQAQPPQVANKLLTDYKLANTDVLGQARKLGAGDRGLAQDHVFGLPSLRNGQRGSSVEELLKTGCPPECMQADADLGKSLREGYRNIAPPDRVFGAPSIRTDIPQPANKSVNCVINYGNEPDARQLLRPPKSVERGVHEAHYMQLRDREEIAALVQEAGISLTATELQQVFSMACNADAEEGRCCLDTFFRARHHLLANTLELPNRQLM